MLRTRPALPKLRPPRTFLLPICCLLVSMGFGLSIPSAGAIHRSSALDLPRIEPNPNQAPAGTLADGVLTLDLEVRQGEWFPESETGPSLKVSAFSERGKAPQIPGPLIRVREGSTIHARVHNLLNAAVILHGLHQRPGKTDDVLTVPPGETREVTFQPGAPGAYYYWASAGGEIWNGRPIKDDSPLTGAFIVDPAGGAPPDRIFVLGIWRDQPSPNKSLDIPTINGKSWPYTERLEYTAGTEVRWRLLNPSNLQHPMHMHGSYYRVDSMGDGEQDTPFPEAMRRLVVTQLLPVGATMTTYWVPERPGRWIFHCHILAHISPEIMQLRQAHLTDHPGMSNPDVLQHMAGLVMGITILPRPGTRTSQKPQEPRRKLGLIVGNRQPAGPNPMGYALIEGRAPGSEMSCPGPPLVLVQGEPVSIRVTNRLSEPTAVHWHGIELDSYYDGVPGWTGDPGHVTPMIQPGKSFEVRFTPPRAGTFIYHTHMNDLSQLSSGLYGPIIVLPPGEKFHPETDRIFIISRYAIGGKGGVLLNGAAEPQPLEWRAGVTYRLRFIGITANAAAQVTLEQNGVPVQWSALAKDGADLPAAQALAARASFTIAPGETYDFTFRPERASIMELLVELPFFHEKVTQAIHVE